jgi:hypothetical protein
VWIRTCYHPELQSVYEQILENGVEVHVEPLLSINIEALYNLPEQDWTRVFLRLPMLPDAVPQQGEDPKRSLRTHTLQLSPPQDKSWLPLCNAVVKSQSVVHLFDKEVLRGNRTRFTFLMSTEKVFCGVRSSHSVIIYLKYSLAVRIFKAFRDLLRCRVFIRYGTFL